jgi:hypothetical protein
MSDSDDVIDEDYQEVKENVCIECDKNLKKAAYHCGECDDAYCKICFFKYCAPLHVSDSESENEDNNEENDYYCPRCYQKLSNAL